MDGISKRKTSFFRALTQSSSAFEILKMDTQTSSRRGLKSAQEQEDWRRHRNERERARRAAETAEQRNKQLRKRRERDRARCAAQTASERQATLLRKSTRERERTAAETPEELERETRLQQMRAIQTGN